MSKVFISYRRSSGNILGQLLSYRLKEDGQEVFFDTESMKPGRFDEQLIQHIDECDTFLLLLTANALDRCIDDGDYVRMEISAALQRGKKIVAVMTPDFEYPEVLPAEIEQIRLYQAIKVHLELAEAFYQQVLVSVGASTEEPSYDIYEELAKRSESLFSSSSKKEKKKGGEEEPSAASEAEKDTHFSAQTADTLDESAANDEDWPDDDEGHRCFSVFDSPGMTTLCFQIRHTQDDVSGKPVELNYLIQLSCREEQVRNGIRKTFSPVFYNGRAKDTTVEITFLTIKDKEHEAILNGGDFKNGILRVGRHPAVITYGRGETKLPEDWVLSSLTDMTEFKDGKEEKTHEIISPFSPEKLEYVIFDPDEKKLIRPKLIRGKDGKIYLKLTIKANYSYIALNVR